MNITTSGWPVSRSVAPDIVHLLLKFIARSQILNSSSHCNIIVIAVTAKYLFPQSPPSLHSEHYGYQDNLYCSTSSASYLAVYSLNATDTASDKWLLSAASKTSFKVNATTLLTWPFTSFSVQSPPTGKKFEDAVLGFGTVTIVGTGSLSLDLIGGLTLEDGLWDVLVLRGSRTDRN